MPLASCKKVSGLLFRKEEVCHSLRSRHEQGCLSLYLPYRKHTKVWETTSWEEMLERIEENCHLSLHGTANLKETQKAGKKENQSAETEGNGKNGECLYFKTQR